MLILQNYEDILNVSKKGKNITVDLSQLNFLDYTKTIDYIKGLEVLTKKVTRSKFMFIYE